MKSGLRSPGLCLLLLSRAEKMGRQLGQPTCEDPCLSKWAAATWVHFFLWRGWPWWESPSTHSDNVWPWGSRDHVDEMKSQSERDRCRALAWASCALNRRPGFSGLSSWGLSRRGLTVLSCSKASTWKTKFKSQHIFTEGPWPSNLAPLDSVSSSVKCEVTQMSFEQKNRGVTPYLLLGPALTPFSAHH